MLISSKAAIMTKKVIFSILLSCSIIFTAFSKNTIQNKDSLRTALDIQTNFDQNLDSLLKLWYLQKAIKTDYSTNKKQTDSISPEFPDSVYIQRLQSIPSVIDFSYNKIVRNYIHVYTKQRRESVEAMIGLSDYYFPKIEEIFESYGLPTELKYMAIIESALNPRAVSRVGATGMWQFMYATARMYDLTINSFVDERRDPI